MRALLPLTLLVGCFQENLPQIDVVGKVVLPRAAATRSVPILEDGQVVGNEEVTDVRLVGPIFVGAYSGIDTTSFTYPHPAMGPVIAGEAGDAFPYGGTTVGRYDYACYESIACKVTTGRFKDYADIIDYFGKVLGAPVVDSHGFEISSADTFQQYCYDYFNITSDQELSFIGDEQFTENADGDFEASFQMPRTTFKEGMTIWGFMDAPVVSVVDTLNNGTFSTCDADAGRDYTEYDNVVDEGAAYDDILNLPSGYLRVGDWVSDGSTTMTSQDDQPTVTLGVSLEE